MARVWLNRLLPLGASAARGLQYQSFRRRVWATVGFDEADFCTSEFESPLVLGATVAAAAWSVRFLIGSWQAFKARPVVPRVQRFYKGGFEQKMTRREAALILGVATFDDYFKPINKQAEIIMKTQLEGEENSMKDMMKAMQTRALLEKYEAERKANVNDADANQRNSHTFLPISPGNLNEGSSTGSPVWRLIPVSDKSKTKSK
ncbi:hypothetical protein NC651_028290 [Populus alba x Populus x berolinensis]|nr:hypothetical protein NC651_028290 [Populus alba x Populus x berolinensis]